ncbi:hypothetical protein [Lysobacter brunescens]|uniref:Uncharacterized protein n=1 Tax=Lysobacter brunescens TaxID=262323 RepID=A0ABW2YEW8_9GAMM
MNEELRAAALHAATAFYDEHAAQYLSRDEDTLQALCGDYIANRYGISTREGQGIAMTARADMLSAGAEGFIDLDRCTSSMVVIRDTAQDRVRMVPVTKLLAISREGGVE